MAMMKYGRFSPKTTDPDTGARIADPEVYGQTIKGGGKVSSWPELRTMFQSGKLNEDFFGKGGTKAKPGKDSRYQLFPQDVKNYLEGKTDKLDDVNYEEPILTEDYAEMGSSRKRTFANLNYKVDSPKWKSAIKKATIPGEKYTPSEEGVNRQVDIGVKEGYGETYGVSSIRKTKETTPTPPPNPPKKESTLDVKEPVQPIIPPKLKRDLPKLKGQASNITPETTWNNPDASKYKTKREIVKSREGGQDQKVKILSKKIDGGYGIRRSKTVNTEDVAKGLRYNREEKMAKAFYAPESVVGKGGYSSRTEDAWDDQGNPKDISKSIKSDVKSIRQEKRDYIAEKGINTSDARGEYNKAIKTAKLASRYAKKADISVSGDDKWREGEGSKLKYFTPDYEKLSSKKVKGAMFGYSEAGKQERSRMNQLQAEEGAKIYPYSKSAEDNAANRNSTTERMKKFWGF